MRRFSVPPSGLFDLAVEVGAEFLDAQSQGADNVVLWALVDDAKPKTRRSFLLCITGTEIKTTLELAHVATVQAATEPPVEFHLFEVKGRPLTVVPNLG